MSRVSGISEDSIPTSAHALQRQKEAKALQQLEADKKIKEEELELKKTDLQQLQDHHEFTKEQILATQNLLEGLRNELAEESRKLDSKKNEYALLKSLIDSMEGYPESVKFLHKNTGWNHEAPLLSDIIYVKEEFRAAVENVLEPYLNYYVVNNLQEGLQAVHLLDNNKKGKANFFLLDKLMGEDRDFGSHNIPETIKAMDVIEVDEKYRSLANYLLGNVFIAESEEALTKTGIFNPQFVKDLVARFMNGEEYLYNRLWALIIIQKFLLKKY